MAQAKRDFGSFHASNVQELIHADEDEYNPPAFPIDIPTFEDLKLEFGGNTKEELFYLDKAWTFLNHGAFGGSLQKAIEAVQKWQIYLEQQPLRFIDRELFPHMVYITRQMAKFVGCHPPNLILIPNVTTGINCIVRSLPLHEGDVVYHLSFAYGAVKKILSVVCEEKDVKLHEEFIPMPVESAEQLVSAVQRSLPAGCKLAVFDHIPSNTPFILPIQQLAALCHERGIQVLVDGAHALGQLSLDISSLGVDFYLTNCHKWFCGPKGTALMYIAPEHHSTVHPLVISHGYKSGFNSQFIWSGLQDYSPFLALHTALRFWEVHGRQAREWNKKLADEAAKLLLKEWGGHLLAPSSMTASMLCVSLPVEIYSHVEQLSYSHAEKIQNALYEANIEVPIKCIQGHLYARISVHVYNSLDEYEHLAKDVMELNERDIL